MSAQQSAVLRQVIDAAPAFKPAPTKPPSLLVTAPIDQFLSTFCAPEWSVEDILQRGYLYSLTGPTGHAKTAVATLLEVSYALQRPFAGKRVATGSVLSLVGENPPDKQGRWQVAFQAAGATPRGIRVLAESFPIRGELERIRADAKENGPYGLVIVDTSAAYFSGDDENDNAQMRLHAADLRELTQINGRPTVVVLAHPTKKAEKDNLLPRGGGSFLAEVDGNLTCWLDGDVATVHWAGKFRGPNFDPLQFRVERRAIEGMTYSNGKPIESVVASHINDHEAGSIARASWESENRVLFAMQQTPGGSIADWARASHFLSAAGEPQKSTVYRHLKQLEADKLVRKFRGKWVLTDGGKREAEKCE